ncbi:MAG TPA: hypothetical protein VGO52_01990 [Hyphomonadaceae bacterium]|nr:hypothetical protein [Hyphomonadaceae bacterium]
MANNPRDNNQNQNPQDRRDPKADKSNINDPNRDRDNDASRKQQEAQQGQRPGQQGQQPNRDEKDKGRPQQR